MTREIDPETQKVYSEGEHLMLMARSEGWGIAKRKLLQLIADTESLRNVAIKEKSPDSIIQEVIAKQLAVEMIITWLGEIEGDVSQHTLQTKQQVEDQRRDDIYKTYGDSGEE